MLGAVGIGVAWWIYSAHRTKAPRPWAVLEHKFYFDELLRPALLLARPNGSPASSRWAIEGPSSAARSRPLDRRARGAQARVRQLQTGLVRTYAFGVAAGLAVLVLVFIAVQMSAYGWITTTLILLPLIASGW